MRGSKVRHSELVSESILLLRVGFSVEKWTLKQVQGDGEYE